MKKLFGNRFALISYFGIIVIFILSYFIAYYIKSPLDQKMVFIVITSTILFFFWSIYIAFLKKDGTLTAKLHTLLLIISPIILTFQIIFIFNTAFGTYSEMLLWMLLFILFFTIIPIGVLNKWVTLSIVIFIFFTGLAFKTFRMPGGNYLLMSVPPLILLNMLYEYFLIRKIQEGKKQYKELFLAQSLAYFLLPASFYFLLFGWADIVVGKIAIYTYFIYNVYIFILLPNKNFFQWDIRLRKRFIQYSVYIGIFFFVIATYFALSDPLGYDLFSFGQSEVFTDYPVDFNSQYAR